MVISSVLVSWCVLVSWNCLAPRRRACASGRARERRRRRRLEVVERGAYAARAVRDLRRREPHLHAAQRAAQHEVVEPAEMPDAEHLAGELAEPLPERHV